MAIIVKLVFIFRIGTKAHLPKKNSLKLKSFLATSKKIGLVELVELFVQFSCKNKFLKSSPRSVLKMGNVKYISVNYCTGNKTWSGLFLLINRKGIFFLYSIHIWNAFGLEKLLGQIMNKAFVVTFLFFL